MSGAAPRLARTTAAVVRWLHIYLSLFAFATMLLFSVTGLSLNHPEWFGVGAGRTIDHAGAVEPGLVGPADADPDGRAIDRERVAAALVAAHGVPGTLSELRADDLECTLAWKGPGTAADAVIDRATGRYTLSVTRHGLVGILNDLHKGRDTGAAWSLVIDVTAVLLTLVAVTGLVLVVFIRRRRAAGLVTALVGAAVLVAVALWIVG